MALWALSQWHGRNGLAPTQTNDGNIHLPDERRITGINCFVPCTDGFAESTDQHR